MHDAAPYRPFLEYISTVTRNKKECRQTEKKKHDSSNIDVMTDEREREYIFVGKGCVNVGEAVKVVFKVAGKIKILS